MRLRVVANSAEETRLLMKHQACTYVIVPYPVQHLRTHLRGLDGDLALLHLLGAESADRLLLVVGFLLRPDEIG